MEVKITQKAMEKLKKEYFLLRENGNILGLISKKQENLLKPENKKYFLTGRNYSTLFCGHIGFTIKDSIGQVKADFEQIKYSAKDTKQTGKKAETVLQNGYPKVVPDLRLVLATVEDAGIFKQNGAIPKKKIKITPVPGPKSSYRSDLEQKVSADLMKQGMPVKDLKSAEHIPSNTPGKHQDTENKKVSRKKVSINKYRPTIVPLDKK